MKTDNELIAEFMGLLRHEDAAYGLWPDPTNNNDIGFGLKYDTSWDWLMPVVIKAKRTPNSAEWCWDILNFSIQGGRLADVHREIVEFITWYNENSRDGNQKKQEASFQGNKNA